MEESYINVDINHLETGTRAMILHSGSTWRYLEAFLAVTPGDGWNAAGIGGEAWETTGHPAMHRTPHSRELSSPNVSVMLRFLALEPEDVEKQIL